MNDSYCICIAASAILYFVLWRENKKRDAEDLSDDEQKDKNAFADLTDMENPYFRYVL